MEVPAKLKGKSPAAPSTSASMSKLIIVFWVSKLALLLLAVASPGPGYDTSTQILLARQTPARADSILARILNHVVLRLTRWDAVYFTTSSTHGHVHEQEWAFSWLLARSTSTIAGAIPFGLSVSSVVKNAIVGILISNLSHLGAVLVLFRLTYEVVPYGRARKRQIAFTTACLHVISPAGLFLSAHYAESPFALFNFLGMLTYVFSQKKSLQRGIPAALTAASWTLSSAVCFGQSAVLRSNGLLSGLIFLWDAFLHVPDLLDVLRSPERMIRLGATLASGILLALAFAAPQVVAYVEYCTPDRSRPWCERTIPSIYTWVQDHYWNVGFLRYWTFSNLPLFVLAAPTVLLLVSTAIAVWQGWPLPVSNPKYHEHGVETETSTASTDSDELFFRRVMARLAAPQISLSLMAITSFHAQTINRISSGYPVWYIMMAIAIHDKIAVNGNKIIRYINQNAQWIVRAMVMYAAIQGGLFSSFLPPA